MYYMGRETSLTRVNPKESKNLVEIYSLWLSYTDAVEPMTAPNIPSSSIPMPYIHNKIEFNQSIAPFFLCVFF